MDIFHTVEEQYLQAIEELNYGELPKALHLFHQIVNAEPHYARAYYQLGSFYYYQFKDYQSAGYYYQKCVSLEPAFPDVYEHYLKLLVTLDKQQLVQSTANKALATPGVCKANIYECLGFYEEGQQHFDTAKAYYKKAAVLSASQDEHSLFEAHIKRICEKQKIGQRMTYAYQG